MNISGTISSGARPIECLQKFLNGLQLFYKITFARTDLFLGCIDCVENIGLGHPFCQEENPNYDPVRCFVVLNKCLIEEATGIQTCMGGGGFPEP